MLICNNALLAYKCNLHHLGWVAPLLDLVLNYAGTSHRILECLGVPVTISVYIACLHALADVGIPQYGSGLCIAQVVLLWRFCFWFPVETWLWSAYMTKMTMFVATESPFPRELLGGDYEAAHLPHGPIGECIVKQESDPCWVICAIWGLVELVHNLCFTFSLCECQIPEQLLWYHL